MPQNVPIEGQENDNVHTPAHCFHKGIKFAALLADLACAGLAAYFLGQRALSGRDAQ